MKKILLLFLGLLLALPMVAQQRSAQPLNTTKPANYSDRSGVECAQEFSNYGYILDGFSSYTAIDDIVVAPNTNFNLEDIVVYYNIETGELIDLNTDVTIYFYNDNNGAPGTPITGIPTYTLIQQVVLSEVGQNSDKDVVGLLISFDSPFELVGGVSGTNYWFGLDIDSYHDGGFLSAAAQEHGSEFYIYYGILGASSDEYNFPPGQTFDLAFDFFGNCETTTAVPCLELNAGTLSVSPESGESGTPVTITLSGHSTGPEYSYTLEYKFNAGNWQSMSFNPPSLTIPANGSPDDVIEFRIVITCLGNGDTETSNSTFYTFTLPSPENCNPGSMDEESETWISGVTTSGADVNFTYSSPTAPLNGYDDQTALPFEAEAGSTIDFIISYEDIVESEYEVKIWVDWDNDGIFYTTGEEVVLSIIDPYVSPETFQLNIPVSTPAGQYKVRIVASWDGTYFGSVDPCEELLHGTFVDFLLTVTAEEEEICDAPTNIAISNVTTEGATVSWTGTTPEPQLGYAVIYGPAGFNPETAQNNPEVTITPISAGTYTSTITGLNDDEAYDVYVVAVCDFDLTTMTPVYSEPLAGNFTTLADGVDCSVLSVSIDANGALEFCEGGSVVLTANYTAGNATVAWSNGGSGDFITVNTNGNYTATVTYDNGCIISASETVTVNALPAITQVTEAFLCVNSTVELISGNQDPNATVKWDGVVGGDTKVVNQAGDYLVEITSAAGCSSSTTITVTESPFPAITFAPTATMCAGGSVTLEVIVDDENATITWNGETGTTSFEATAAGTYIIAATNANGCAISGSITVTEIASPVISVDNAVVSICENGSADLEVTVDDANATITWNGVAGGTTYEATQVGTYTVVATNTNGCSSTATIEVTLDGGPAITLDGTATFCAGDDVTITAVVDDANATITWNGEAGTPSLLVSAAGTYTIVATNANGCSSSASVTVTENDAPSVADITATVTGSSASFVANGVANATSYSWDFGDESAVSTDAAPTHEYATDGNYTVTLTVSNECGYATATTTVTITTTGIATNELGNLSVYPVPANEVVTFEYVGVYELQSLVVVNSIGQVVYNGATNNGTSHQLDVTNFSAGLYHVNIFLSNGDVMQRKIDVIK